MTDPTARAASSRNRTIAYWMTTALVGAEGVAGGLSDLLNLPYVVRILAHLGYPSYFHTILGVGKLLGAAAVLVPRHPRLKEWAYAGLIFSFIGALASHIAVGDGAGALAAPLFLGGLVAASWSLRPPDRRL